MHILYVYVYTYAHTVRVRRHMHTLYMYVYICTYDVYVYTYAHTVHVYICTHMYVYTYAHTVHVYICTYCMCIRMHILCVRIFMYVRICTSRHLNIRRLHWAFMDVCCSCLELSVIEFAIRKSPSLAVTAQHLIHSWYLIGLQNLHSTWISLYSRHYGITFNVTYVIMLIGPWS